ncbi:uncharacterized protein LOC143913705 [Arctopsyche grandis]|uniref:uncharacterized protein LOC143913705 n=1 Tax=Arctopsyche grandis TaxID=121162 RepID=UPI00406D6A83
MSLNVCRCCLRPSDIPLESIFNPNNAGIYIAEMISICASVPILQRDDLPNGICAVCLTELNLSYNFRKKCANSFNELSHLCNSNVSSKINCNNTHKTGVLIDFKNVEGNSSNSELSRDSIAQYDAEKYLYLLPKYKDKQLKQICKGAKSSSNHKALYKCLGCEISFHNKSHLKKHIKSTHYQKCKQYYQKSSKTVHKYKQKKSKSGKRFFICTPCNEIFQEKETYKNHSCPKLPVTNCQSPDPEKNGLNESSASHIDKIIVRNGQQVAPENVVKDLLQKFESLHLKKKGITQL